MTPIQIVPLTITASGLFLFVARRTRLPQSLLLISAGILTGLLPGLPEVRLNPSIVLEVLLPPLLYAGTVNFSLLWLRTNLTAGLLLGVALIFATTAAVTAVATASIPNFPLVSAVLLGLIASVAGADEFKEVNKRLKIPRRLADMLKAEGLLSPIVIVSSVLIAQKAGETGTFTWANAVGEFAADLVFGSLLGFGIGYVIARLRRSINEAPVELAVSFTTPYIVALAASTIGISSIPAIVVAGFVIAADYIDPRTGATRAAPYTRLAADGFWQVSEFIVGGVLLFLLGLELPTELDQLGIQTLPMLIVRVISLLIVVLAVRFIFAYAAVVLMANHHQLSSEVATHPVRASGLLTWAGTRSIIGVVVALSIPLTTEAGKPFPARDLLVSLTCLVTLVSIAIQGLTLAPLIRALRLANRSEEEREERTARRSAAQAGFEKLKDYTATDPAFSNEENHRQQLQQYYEQRLNGKTNHELATSALTLSESFRNWREAMLNAERRSLLLARDQNKLSDESFKRLVYEIDVEAERLKINPSLLL